MGKELKTIWEIQSLQIPNVIVNRDNTKSKTSRLKPTANTYGTVYTAFGWERQSTLWIANTSTATTVFIHIVPVGWTADTTNAIWSGGWIEANESKIFTDILPAQWETIQVKSVSGNVCFTYNYK